ncbi:MAG: hypothetical protein A2075_04535 [Geobacteraceae bacterium GWC2_58_44]|nr:MAG: hypothetical protein A2075_04535 [Geobacteraceae bacterium GWC2_58_44]HBG05521.1 hypothetical protein [Geobacter sp.]
MFKQKIAAGCIFLLCLETTATAAMYKIENPASTIKNPADKMSNPATNTSNPASNIYNPGSRMDNPSPMSPPTQPVPVQVPKATEVSPEKVPAQQTKDRPGPSAAIPPKKYHFRSVNAYLEAAKRSFARDDYAEFLSITEDALRRINAGTLKASPKSRQQLIKYRKFGHDLLGNGVNE